MRKSTNPKINAKTKATSDKKSVGIAKTLRLEWENPHESAHGQTVWTSPKSVPEKSNPKKIMAATMASNIGNPFRYHARRSPGHCTYRTAPGTVYDRTFQEARRCDITARTGFVTGWPALRGSRKCSLRLYGLESNA